MGADPIRQRLRPRCFRVSQVRRPQHRYENLRHPHLAGERVDDRHLLAGVVDEGLMPRDMGLAHGRRQPPLKGAIQLAEPRVAIPFRVNLLIFLPQDHQVDPWALHLPRQRRPVRLNVTPHARLQLRRRKQALLQHGLGQTGGQRPAEVCRTGPGEVALHRATRHAKLAGDRTGTGLRPKMQLQNLSYPPHGQSLRRHSTRSIDCDGALDAR